MSYDLQNGYQPRTFSELLEIAVPIINAQFNTSYDSTTILGTNHYKTAYTAIQLVMNAEAEFAQITAKMTDYIRTANEKINLPKSTIDGFIEGLRAPEDEGGLALNSTIKNITDPAEAGYLFLVVDLDDGEKASGEIEITDYANLVSGTDDVITINGTAFTAQTGSVTPGAGTFQAATSNDATATSLAAQINAHATIGLLVKATANGAVVTLEAIHGGEAGNAITLAYTDNDSNIGATVSGATLTGGTDNPDFGDLKDAVIQKMHDWLTAGLYYAESNLRVKSGSVVAINGQTFNYKFCLPTLVEILVRITVTPSATTQLPIKNENQIRDIFNVNFAELYRIGLDFEPEKYLEIERDLPFAADILLEYSEDGGSTWNDQPRTMAHYEKIEITAPASIIIS